MNDNQFAYLRMQYDQGIQLIKHWVDARYKMLQFVGTYNGAVVGVLAAITTLSGSNNNALFLNGSVSTAMVISILSILIALMGLSTEFSTASYLFKYFEVLRDIEETLNQANEPVIEPSATGEGVQVPSIVLAKVGIASHGRTLEKYGKKPTEPGIRLDKRVHTWLPVHNAHKIFYAFLIVIWIVVLLSQFQWFIENINLRNLQ